MRHALWPEGSVEEHRAELRELFGPGGGFDAFVAEAEDGTLVGFIELSLRSHAEGCWSHPVGYVEGWYVDQDWRRRGIGGALIAAGERWAVDRGCSEMASDTQLDNVTSQTAHGRLGYVEVERAVHFRKPLRKPGDE